VICLTVPKDHATGDIPVLAKSELKIGAYYEGECRNSDVARWNGKVFLFWCTKFGDVFIDDVPHFEHEEPGMDYFARSKEVKCDGPEASMDAIVSDILPVS
jgi:hypothetical protein